MIIVGFILLTSLVFYPVIFQGKMFGSADTLNPKAAGLILDKTAIEERQYPLWQPWIFSGMPTAEAFTNISKLYYPYYFLRALFLPGIFIQILHLIFAGIGGFVLLRHLKVSKMAAFLGGAGFMLTPYMITMIVFGHGSQMMTAAYIPWVFWSTLKIFDKPNITNIGLLALMLGLQLQRAHAQIAYYTLMLVGVFVLMQIVNLFLIPNERKSIGIGTGFFILGAILAIGMAMNIYLPSMEYSPFSVRGAGEGGAQYGYATGWSFHPKEMLTFLLPSAYGFGGQTYFGFMPFTDYPNYMGIVILILAIIGGLRRRDNLTLFLMITSVLAVLISFGKHFSLVYDLFYNYFPFFNKFRVPSMVLILLQFNVAVLAAFGLNSLLDMRGKPVPRWIFISSGIVALFILALAFGETFLHNIVSSGYTTPRGQDPRLINILRWKLWYKDAWLMTLLSGALLGVIYLWIQDKITRNMLLGLILTLAITDLWIVNNRIIQPNRDSGRRSQLISRKALDRHYTPDEVTDFIVSKMNSDYFRIYPLGQLFGESRFKAFGIESVGGYHPAKLKVYNKFLENTRNISTIQLMRMMNVHYLISAQRVQHPDLKQVFQGKLRTGSGFIQAVVYQVNNSLPRAWFVEDVITATESEIQKMVTDNMFNPEKTAFISDNSEFAGTVSSGEIIELDKTTQSIRINTKSNGQGFLVVSEVFYPLRWKASIDGKPVKTYKVNGVIRGISVPKGEHTVLFDYDRISFNMGRNISLVSLIIILSLIGFGIYNNHTKMTGRENQI